MNSSMSIKKLQIQLRRYYTSHNRCKDIALLIGCNRNQFKDYIDNLLIHPMTSINNGNTWQFDHIVPMSLFNDNEQDIAWNYRNIIPMLKEDNISKGQSIHFSYQYLLKRGIIADIDKHLIDKCNNELSKYDKYLDKLY